MTNTDTVLALYGAMAANDPDAAVARLAPDAVLHIPGRNPLAGDHAGPAAILGVLGRMGDAAARTELIDVLAGREHVAAYCRVQEEGGLDNPTVHLFRMTDDDRVAEIWFHNRDQAAVDAYWTGADR
jgi:ketosteroid isomerase-like protein